MMVICERILSFVVCLIVGLVAGQTGAPTTTEVTSTINLKTTPTAINTVINGGSIETTPESSFTPAHTSNTDAPPTITNITSAQFTALGNTGVSDNTATPSNSTPGFSSTSAINSATKISRTSTGITSSQTSNPRNNAVPSSQPSNTQATSVAPVQLGSSTTNPNLFVMPATCSAPIEVPGASISMHGAFAVYQCRPGYINDNFVSMCLPDSTWLQPRIKCEPRDCGSQIPEVLGATASYKSTVFTSTVTYSCNEADSYSYESGTTTITCGADGLWSEINLKCSKNTYNKQPLTRRNTGFRNGMCTGSQAFQNPVCRVARLKVTSMLHDLSAFMAAIDAAVSRALKLDVSDLIGGIKMIMTGKGDIVALQQSILSAPSAAVSNPQSQSPQVTFSSQPMSNQNFQSTVQPVYPSQTNMGNIPVTLTQQQPINTFAQAGMPQTPAFQNQQFVPQQPTPQMLNWFQQPQRPKNKVVQQQQSQSLTPQQQFTKPVQQPFQQYPQSQQFQNQYYQQQQTPRQNQNMPSQIRYQQPPFQSSQQPQKFQQQQIMQNPKQQQQFTPQQFSQQPNQPGQQQQQILSQQQFIQLPKQQQTFTAQQQQQPQQQPQQQQPPQQQQQQPNRFSNQFQNQPFFNTQPFSPPMLPQSQQFIGSQAQQQMEQPTASQNQHVNRQQSLANGQPQQQNQQINQQPNVQQQQKQSAQPPLQPTNSQQRPKPHQQSLQTLTSPIQPTQMNQQQQVQKPVPQQTAITKTTTTGQQTPTVMESILSQLLGAQFDAMNPALKQMLMGNNPSTNTAAAPVVTPVKAAPKQPAVDPLMALLAGGSTGKLASNLPNMNMLDFGGAFGQTPTTTSNPFSALSMGSMGGGMMNMNMMADPEMMAEMQEQRMTGSAGTTGTAGTISGTGTGVGGMDPLMATLLGASMPTGGMFGTNMPTDGMFGANMLNALGGMGTGTSPLAAGEPTTGQTTAAGEPTPGQATGSATGTDPLAALFGSMQTGMLHPTAGASQTGSLMGMNPASNTASTTGINSQTMNMMRKLGLVKKR